MLDINHVEANLQVIELQNRNAIWPCFKGNIRANSVQINLASKSAFPAMNRLLFVVPFDQSASSDASVSDLREIGYLNGKSIVIECGDMQRELESNRVSVALES